MSYLFLFGLRLQLTIIKMVVKVFSHITQILIVLSDKYSFFNGTLLFIYLFIYIFVYFYLFIVHFIELILN